jgi:hypothetical protein
VAAFRAGSYGTKGAASSANVPGGRTNAISWTDSRGSFWLFGGLGYDSTGNYGYLNDLWEFNSVSLEWTWISGSESVPEFLGVTGTYGTRGSFAPANNPGVDRSGFCEQEEESSGIFAGFDCACDWNRCCYGLRRWRRFANANADSHSSYVDRYRDDHVRNFAPKQSISR